MPTKYSNKPSTDITHLPKTSMKKRKKKMIQILQSIGVKEFFEKGKISIDKKTCKGIECQLCIKVCPTNALFWKSGEVSIAEELCVFCAACVANCIVDNCIRVVRRRQNGGIERFSKPTDVLMLLNSINSEKRKTTIRQLFFVF